MKDNRFTIEQAELIKKKFSEGITDYAQLAILAFKDPTLTARSYKAKWVRDFLIIEGNMPHPEREEKEKVGKKTPALTPDQIEFIDNNIQENMSPKQIAIALFNKEFAAVTNLNVYLTPQYKLIHNYVKVKYPDLITDSESATVDETYAIPRILSTCIKKVNKWAGKNLDEDPSKLSMKDKRCMEKLLLYLQSPRFVSNYNSYLSESDKDLFESEYVRSIWDKPDLTVDEINLYIGLCMDYVAIKQINAKKSKLNQLFEETQDQHDITMRLTEMIKAVSEELNQTSTRVEKIIQKLNGSRSERLKNRQQGNASFLSLTETFQDEQERVLMIMRAELQNKAVLEEANRLESMEEWKARVLGISKEEIFND